MYDDDEDVEFDGSTAMTGDGVALGSPMSRLLYDVGHGMFRGGEDHAMGVQEDDIDESSAGDMLSNSNDKCMVSNAPRNTGNLLELFFLLEIIEISWKFAKSPANFLTEFVCLLLL